MTLPVALTIAGSDSGGGAGIQADLKTFRALGVHGTSAITCLTAQNPDAVAGIEAVTPEMVGLQIRTVCEGFPVAAAKTGMLYSSEIIASVATALDTVKIPALVVDPVMVATSGARLLRNDAIKALCSEILPKARVVTPNVPEAEILCEFSISSVDELRDACRRIAERFGVACVAKGGHLPGSHVIDILFADGKTHEFTSEREDAGETHGTGCTFSAALTALLALGKPMPEAVQCAKEFVASAIRNAQAAGKHYPLAV